MENVMGGYFQQTRIYGRGQDNWAWIDDGFADFDDIETALIEKKIPYVPIAGTEIVNGHRWPGAVWSIHTEGDAKEMAARVIEHIDRERKADCRRELDEKSAR